MPMTLKGSCKCGAVGFSVESRAPYPYQLCYCSICRKTGGGGGYAINLHAEAGTLEVSGRKAIGVFRAGMEDGHTSSGERSFCTRCGTALWLFDPTWPELLHPMASAIDGELPVPPARTHLLLGSKASWVEPDIRSGDLAFDDVPQESIEAWHRRHGLWIE